MNSRGRSVGHVRIIVSSVARHPSQAALGRGPWPPCKARKINSPTAVELHTLGVEPQMLGYGRRTLHGNPPGGVNHSVPRDVGIGAERVERVANLAGTAGAGKLADAAVGRHASRRNAAHQCVDALIARGGQTALAGRAYCTVIGKVPQRWVPALQEKVRV